MVLILCFAETLKNSSQDGLILMKLCHWILAKDFELSATQRPNTVGG